MDDTSDSCESTLTVVNARSEYERASVWLQQASARAGLSNNLAATLQVVLDEVLSNIVTHSLAGAPEGSRDIELCMRIRAGTVELEILDDGPAFDPTGAVPEAKASRIAGRREGGVGLLFVRSLMDEVRFARRGGRNHLTLRKRIQRDGAD